MSAWTVGQQVSLNRNSVVTIDRVTPSGRAFVGDRQYNLNGLQRGGYSTATYKDRGIEVLTPELLKRINLVKRYTKARTLMHHAAQDLNAWATKYCSFYSERMPDLAGIEQIERVASAAVAALPVEKKGRAMNAQLFPDLPYVPSERLVVGRRVTIARYQPELYRCETDAEMAERHAVERAEYDRQVCDYPICSTRGAGHPLACNCRTATPKAAP